LSCGRLQPRLERFQKRAATARAWPDADQCGDEIVLLPALAALALRRTIPLPPGSATAAPRHRVGRKLAPADLRDPGSAAGCGKLRALPPCAACGFMSNIKVFPMA
jgi:hypothetical protein